MADLTKRKGGKQDLQGWNGTASYTFTAVNDDGRTMTLMDVDWVGVDVVQMYGARTTAALTEALTAIGTSALARVYLAPGSWPVSDDYDISAYTNIQFHFPPGMSFTIAPQKTLTLPSPYHVEAGHYKIFNHEEDIDGNRGATAFGVPGKTSVKWFGAVGDGSTNDDTAIDEAITAGGGGTIYFPRSSGNYIITSISLGTARTTLEGDGWNTIIEYAGTSGNIISLSANVCGMRNIGVTGPGVNGTDYAVYMPHGTSKGFLERVCIYNVGSGLGTDQFLTRINACYIYTVGNYAIATVGNGGGGVLVIEGSTYLSNNGATQGTGVGIGWDSTTAGQSMMVVTDTNIEGFEYGLYGDLTTTSPLMLKYSNVHCEDNTTDVRLGLGTTTATFNNCRFGSVLCTTELDFTKSTNSSITLSGNVHHTGSTNHLITGAGGKVTFVGNSRLLDYAKVSGAGQYIHTDSHVMRDASGESATTGEGNTDDLLTYTIPRYADHVHSVIRGYGAGQVSNTNGTAVIALVIGGSSYNVVSEAQAASDDWKVTFDCIMTADTTMRCVITGMEGTTIDYNEEVVPTVDFDNATAAGNRIIKFTGTLQDDVDQTDTIGQKQMFVELN